MIYAHEVKGIGRWTAEMFLIFCLGRLDILPVTATAKAMQKTYSLSELPKPAEILSIAQPWKPYRTVATWYLWKSLSKFDSIGLGGQPTYTTHNFILNLFEFIVKESVRFYS